MHECKGLFPMDGVSRRILPASALRDSSCIKISLLGCSLSLNSTIASCGLSYRLHFYSGRGVKVNMTGFLGLLVKLKWSSGSFFL